MKGKLETLELEKDSVTAELLASKALKNSNLISQFMSGVSSPKAKVRFKSVKALKIISERAPEKLKSKWDFFKDMLKSKNNIMKWNALDILANLSSVVSEKQFSQIFEQFYQLLGEGSLVTAAHVVDNSAKIALAQPGLREKIVGEILRVEEVPLPTNKCRNILAGKAIVAFDQFFKELKNKKEIIEFVKRQVKSSHQATKRKAEKFLKACWGS
jgi:hypothetical protein